MAMWVQSGARAGWGIACSHVCTLGLGAPTPGMCPQAPPGQPKLTCTPGVMSEELRKTSMMLSTSLRSMTTLSHAYA